MKKYFYLLISAMILSGCAKKPQEADRGAFDKEIAEWKADRLARLTKDDGWLTLCGLFWLKEGENTFGSDSANQIILPPGKAPAKAGFIMLDHGSLSLTALPKAEIKYKDSTIKNIVLHSDDEGVVDPTIVTINTMMMYVIKRGDQLGVRVKDKENSARVNFKGLDYFPADPKWRVEAKFEPYNPPKILEIMSMANTVEKDSCPGALSFEIEGKPYKLDVVIEAGSEDKFFIMFGDETSGKETYGMGRQLYTPLPDANGKVILDFNKAYNWPCVFTPYATCPIPPRQNRLALRVEAGEKMYEGHE